MAHNEAAPQPELIRGIGFLQATTLNMVDMIGVGPLKKSTSRGPTARVFCVSSRSPLSWRYEIPAIQVVPDPVVGSAPCSQFTSPPQSWSDDRAEKAPASS